MDGDGREQDVGRASTTEENPASDPNSPIRPEGRGQDRQGGGAMNTDRSDKAVDIQSIVEKEDYSGSAESGV